jgi:hypothetical protein
VVGREGERGAEESARGEEREQQPTLGIGQVELRLDLGQGAEGQEGKELVGEADEQERAEQAGRGPDGGGEYGPTG